MTYSLLVHVDLPTEADRVNHRGVSRRGGQVGSSGGAQLGGRPALIGRTRELSFLTDLLSEAKAGRGQVAVLAGPAGVGKTRLASELADQSLADGVVVAWGRCWQGPGAATLWPWEQVLEALGQGVVGHPLGLGDEPDHVAIARLVLGSVSHLKRAALIIVDDIHAADELSLHVLRAICQAIGSRRALIVIAHREKNVEVGSIASRTLSAVRRMGATLDLVGLTEAETASYFEQVAGYPPPSSIASAVYRATEGNPFFVREMARQATTAQGIYRPDRSVGFSVPAGTKELIGERLGDLPDEVRTILRTAAAMGLEFEMNLLQHAIGVEAAVVLDVLAEGVRQGIIEEREEAGRYVFSHVLVRETLYEELSPKVRGGLHAALAIAIERLDPHGERRLGELAHHYFKAGAQGDLVRALDYSTRAGHDCLARREHEEAARYFWRALKVAQLTDAPVAAQEALRRLLSQAEVSARYPVRGADGEDAVNSMTREAEYWTIHFAGSTCRFKDSKGLRYLAELLGHPGREFLALDLASAVGTDRASPREVSDAHLSQGREDAGETIDPEARRVYRARLKELVAEIDEAKEFNDPEREARAKEEMDYIERELVGAIGLGGRSRKAASAVDRARMSVTRALRNAIDRIADGHPALGRHLEVTIRTGNYVSYTPDPRVPTDWQL